MSGERAININVKVAEREFKLSISADAESEIRTAAKLITEVFEMYRDKFPKDDYARVLAKSALHVLVEQNKKTISQNGSELMFELYNLEESLDNFVKEEL